MGKNYRRVESAIFMRYKERKYGADRPFLKALQIGDTKFKIALLPLFLCLQN